MAAQKGRDVLLKLNTVSTTYVAIAGMREPTITINNEPVDITNADDAGIRKLLEGAGVTSVSIKAQGVFMDDTYVATVRAAALANTHKNFQFVIPGSSAKTYQGAFMVASFEEAGSYNGQVTYNLTLESAGAVTIS